MTADAIHGDHTHSISVPWRLELPAGEPPPGGFPLLVALHGYGESGDAFARRVAFGEDCPYARLFPSGPFPVVVGEGDARRRGCSWYVYTGDAHAFTAELGRASAALAGLVDAVAAAHPVRPREAVLLGYSQGGYLAGFTGVSERARYRGVVAVSCRIKTEVLGDALAAARGYPVLIVHGRRDESVGIDPQRAAFEELKRAGLDARWHEHAGGHGMRRATLPVIDGFVREVLGSSAP